MAAGEARWSSLRCQLRQPLASLRPSLPENPADLSDSSGECDENSRNVVRWLESLPLDNRWCEAEEQIARTDSSEAFIDGISSIGDTDVPIILKSQTNPRTEISTAAIKKISRDKKYRRGALHANSSSKETPQSVKKMISNSERISATKKSSISSNILNNSQQTSSVTSNNENIQYSPVFNNPEFGKMLDGAMSRAINKYKRSVRTWERTRNNEISTRNYEPPSKRSKAPNKR